MTATQQPTAPLAAELLTGAQWITTSAPVPPAGQRPAYEFRAQFTLADVPEHAALHATAHGIYEAFINGVRVGDQELAPGATSYHKTLYVQSYEVASLLRAGSNELRFVVSDGWFRGKCGPRRLADNFGTEIALIARLDMPAETLVTDTSWKVAEGAIISADLMDGQTTDLRRIGQENWEPAVFSGDVLTDDWSRLKSSPAPPVRTAQTYPAAAVTRLESGRQIVDFGQILNGRVRLRLHAAAGTSVTLTHGEALDAQGDLTLANLDYFQGPGKPVLGVGQRDVVISRGVDGDVFEPTHTTHGFRYVAVDGLEQDVQLDDIDAVLLRSDLPAISEFTTGNERVNELHRISVASWRANTLDLPTDCPQRERWGYTGDFQIFVRSAAFLENIDGFARKWLQSLADDQQPNGLVRNVAPHCGVPPVDPARPISFDGAAGWGDAATIVPAELFRQYGDPQVLAENYPMMSAWVDYAAGVAASGRHPSRVEARPEPAEHEQWLWDSGWQWGEWLEPDVPFDYFADKAVVATAYLARSAQIVADAARLLGKDADAVRFGDLAERAADAWRQEFLTAEGTVEPATQANIVRGLAFGLIPQEHVPAAAAQLVGLIEANGNRLTTGFLSTGLLLPVLADTGHADVAYRLLFQTEEPSWMTMLDRGATTVWEAWNGIDADGNAHESLNHYSKGAVIAFLHEYSAGITPLEPGYARIGIRPFPDRRLGSVAASLESPHGRVASSWVWEGDTFTLNVEVPAGTSAQVTLPNGAVHEVGPGTAQFSISLTN